MSKYQHYGDSADEIMDQPEGEDRYKVGYKNPPKDTRFKPGQSGNPSGRPKQQKSQQESLQDILLGPITIIEDGQHKEVRRIDAIFLAQVNKAMKGDNKAAAQILALTDKYKLAEPEERKITQIEWIIVDHTSATPAKTAPDRLISGADTIAS